MKKIAALSLAVVMLSCPAAALEAATPTGPALTSPSSILMEKETGTVLLEENAHEQLQPASVTKIMTILLVMEAFESGRLSRDELITASAYASGMGGSQVYLKEGEQMSAWEMLKCVVVSSGNDAAVALAEHLAGSEEAFVTQMNQRAAQLGMEDTHFLNCTGLPAQGHVTSAYDIALMSRELILKHPDLRELTTIWMDTIRSGEFGLTNTNRLVRFYSGATGLKTGSTDSALYCISATAERDGMELIAVILKAPTSNERFSDATSLLDYGFANYALTNVYPSGALPTVEVLLGTALQVQPQLSRDCRLLISKGQEGSITTNLALAEDVEAPVEQGQTLGQMEVYVDGVLRDSVPLVACQSVDRLSVGGLFSRMLRTLLMAE